jgi:hypothetical protein
MHTTGLHPHPLADLRLAVAATYDQDDESSCQPNVFLER